MPQPYNGNEPFLFVSYSSKDKDEVFPIISYLQEQDFRIWFDRGNKPSEDRSVSISKKLLDCSIFVAFFSNNYYDSQFCPGEIYTALKKRKQILIIYLRNEPMPPEFEVWYDRFQPIPYYDYPDMNAFLKKFLETRNIEQCRSNAQAAKANPLVKSGTPDAEELFVRGNQLFDAKDYEKAVACYHTAAIQGHAGAQYALGNCYFDGHGVKQNYAKAMKWYLQAAEQGNAQAQYMLGLGYHLGLGIEKSPLEAAYWFQKSAEQGYAAAQRYLGDWYAASPSEQDHDEAAKWYRMAAEQNDANAQFTLGKYYQNGKGVPQDFKEAVKWFLKAAENGFVKAEYALGTCYENGYGVPKDQSEAEKWFRKAYMHGDTNAKAKLSNLKQE